MKIVLLFLALTLPVFGDAGQYPKDWPLTTFFPDTPNIWVDGNSERPFFGRPSFEQGGHFYGLQRLDLPKKSVPTNLEKGYEAVKQLYLKVRTRRLEKDEAIEIAGVSGRRFVFVDESEKAVTDIRIIYVGNIAFEFRYARPLDAEPTEVSRMFFSEAKMANQAIVPTPAAVTPAADAPVAPVTGAADQ